MLLAVVNAEMQVGKWEKDKLFRYKSIIHGIVASSTVSAEIRTGCCCAAVVCLRLVPVPVQPCWPWICSHQTATGLEHVLLCHFQMTSSVSLITPVTLLFPMDGFHPV